MPGITYDTGALIAAERNNRRMWALHRRALEQGIVPSVPAAVLAQGWRGGPQPLMSRFLSNCDWLTIPSRLSFAVGAGARPRWARRIRL